MSIGVPCSTLPVAWFPAWPSSQENRPSTSPSILELEASLGLLSLRHRLDSAIPLPSPSFREESLPSPPTTSPTLVLVLTPTSPSLHSSPSPPTHWCLPPHCCQVRGTSSSPTSSTPSLTLGDANSQKENSSPYSQHQRATPQNWEQRLRMQSQQMF